MKFFGLILFLGLSAASFAQTPGAPESPSPVLVPTYQSIHDVIFVQKCLKCHTPGQRAEDVPLEPYAKMMADGGIVIPGDLTRSSLLREIQKGDMPPVRSGIPAVTPEEFAAIKLWIANGAKGE